MKKLKGNNCDLSDPAAPLDHADLRELDSYLYITMEIMSSQPCAFHIAALSLIHTNVYLLSYSTDLYRVSSDIRVFLANTGRTARHLTRSFIMLNK